MSLARFTAAGEAVFIYEDRHPLLELGRGETKRASHVEPTEDGLWQADMGPVGGPKLNMTNGRDESLIMEISWIHANMIAFI